MRVTYDKLNKMVDDYARRIKIRAYELQKGDRFSIATSALDKIPQRLFFYIEVIGMHTTKLPIKLKLPFIEKWVQMPLIRKKKTYVDFVFLGGEL